MADAVYTQGQRAIELLRLLHHSHGWVTIEELSVEFGESRATTIRIFAMLRRDFEVVITYHRSPQDSPPGYYSIDDWGLFDRQRVLTV
ncbi:hypothetical protein [Sedimenticola hydrogenitrophicus]|uniref:hypothetical protein n=1 Tax=Sedimenticola hydrogenitrophicus TaxID=2967975 RepID=UPI0023B01672|nr:hypothetical protein [Sedimenticola hydrogenitrophicus]